MAIYYKAFNTGWNITQKEMPIYGASRLGVYMKAPNPTNDVKNYQITDHLGNVRAVAYKNPANPTQVLVASYADYYPFGEQLQNRNSNSGNYRYTYQGQEKDPETQMEAFQLRMWDGRLGRWLSPDPYGQYASPYLGMGNNPINGVDPDGGWYDPPTEGAFENGYVHTDDKGSWKYNSIDNTWWDLLEGGNNIFHGATILNDVVMVGVKSTGKSFLDDGSWSRLQLPAEYSNNFFAKKTKSFGDFNIDNAIRTLNSKAYATHNLVPKKDRGACARFVRYAVEDGFNMSRDELTRLNPRSPIPARDWGPFLEGLGFNKLSTSNYLEGDIVVMQGYPGGSSDKNGVPYGHIAMYNGKQWVSYWNQNSIYANSSYRQHNPTHFIYRWK
jgi:RHS repeat-associated protein